MFYRFTVFLTLLISLLESITWPGVSSVGFTQPFYGDTITLGRDASGNLLFERKYVWGADVSGSHMGAGGAGGLLLIRERRGQGGTE